MKYVFWICFCLFVLFLIWFTTKLREYEREKREKEKAQVVQKEEKIQKEREEIMPLNALKQIEALVGMEDAKAEVRKLVEFVQSRRELRRLHPDKKFLSPDFNVEIVGNAGSGKTTFAKLLGKLYYELGIVSEEKFVESNRIQLVGEHIGHTASQVSAVLHKSSNGVLFVDDAHALITKASKGENSDFGQEAIDTLILLMEKYRDRYTVFFAGYPAEMKRLPRANQGYDSRIQIRIHLKDYTPKEIALITQKCLKKLSLDASEAMEAIEKYINQKSENGTLPGNARFARNVAEKIVREQMIRVTADQNADLNKILPCDVESAFYKKPTKEEREGFEEIKKGALEKIESMMGLEEAKQSVRKALSFQSVQKKREEAGLPVMVTTKHMFFTGAPGTGKTTMARYIGEFMRGAGLLSNGHFIEATREDLVGSNTNPSESVRRMIEQARGGILFIDEAYSLANGDWKGKEAIAELVKVMEDERKDLAVIFAGYEREMQELLEVNPGLESRISTKIHFPNYNTQELYDIAISMFKENMFELEDNAKVALLKGIENAYQKGKVEGNGRWARNIVDAIVMEQSVRIEMEEDEDFITVLEEDVVNVLGQSVQTETTTLKVS